MSTCLRPMVRPSPVRPPSQYLGRSFVAGTVSGSSIKYHIESEEDKKGNAERKVGESKCSGNEVVMSWCGGLDRVGGESGYLNLYLEKCTTSSRYFLFLSAYFLKGSGMKGLWPIMWELKRKALNIKINSLYL